MADYFSRITQCIQYVQAKVGDGDGTPQIQLNRRQCVYLAHELSKLSQFLQDREVHHLGLEEVIPRTALLHLHGTVKRAQMLVEGCCCENCSWLATGITMGDTKEEFIAILLDLHQWKFVLGMAMCASAGVSEKAELQQLWETGEEGYQSLSKKNSMMQNGIRDAARQDQEELLERIVNSIIEDERGDDYVRGVYLKAWLNPDEVNLQNVEELRAHSFSEDMGGFLGKGGSGSVVKGKWLGQEVAFKIQENIDPTEATVLGKLQHPNIVRLFHYWEDTVDCERSCIVMELMPRDLQKHIARVIGQRPKLPLTTRVGEAGSMPFLLPVAIDSMLQVAQAMRELHERGLMHRDLKTSNILVKPVHEGYLELHSEGYLEVKLADFGSAETYANTSQTKDLTRYQGTTAYGAPEIFEKEKIIRERNFPRKPDVWSFGMTCSEILTGAIPFAGENRLTLHARIKKDGLRPDLPEDCPWYLQLCIRSCWELNPQKRPSFLDLCKMLRHAKLMSLGLIDVVDVKCLFLNQTAAGVLKSDVHLLQAQEEAKKSRFPLGALWYNLRGAEGSSKLQPQKSPTCGADDSAKSQKSSGRDSLHTFKLGDVLTPGLSWRSRRNRLKMQQILDKCEIKTTSFAYSELVKATENFGDHMKLGRGGFGEVYKGILLDGSAVAVKRLRNAEETLFGRKANGVLFDEFVNEVIALASLKHQNLVSLQGVCIHRDMSFMVCELVGNSNLAETLFEQRNNQPLSWPTRFNICLGVARGLHYLHAEVNPKFIHRDIKSSNVLLDLNLQPKISDLGLACFFPADQSHDMTTHVVGTPGYLAPEHAIHGQVSDKVDVYSFGVLVLEVLSGKRALSYELPGHEGSYALYQWAWDLNAERRLFELVDPTLLTQHEEEGEVQRVLSTALACVQTIAGKRPTMAQVLGMFQGKIEIPELVVDETNEILDDDFHILGPSISFVDEESQELDLNPTIFDFSELRKATRNFHPDMKLGEGGFGVVYKGVLPDASVVAVKQLLIKEQKSMDEFSNEVALLSRAKHQNLVALKGYCLRGDRRMLVYEFVDNCDLAVTLFEHKGRQLVTWPTRFNICLGVAQGLHYLHAQLNPSIVHRDINANNVLLDLNLHPKISDFGLALLMPEDNIPHGTNIQIGGTRGYMAPEYATLGQISDKVDVYSFGVLVLEVVSGRRNISFDLPGGETYLINWAWKLNAERRLMELVDPTLLIQHEEEGEVQRVLSTALACVQTVAGKRPTMAQVLGMFSMIY